MSREQLLSTLDRYQRFYPDEADCVARVRALVEGRADCFERTCLPGHLTASCWILDHERERFLLTHHRKLGRWLQLGGHADGDSDLLQVALREAREESGMQRFARIDPPASGGSPPLPVDIDVHAIPARRGEPAHEHHDLRFIFVADPGQPLVISDESSDLAWFELEAISEVGGDESLLRLARKATALRHLEAHSPADH